VGRRSIELTVDAPAHSGVGIRRSRASRSIFLQLIALETGILASVLVIVAALDARAPGFRGALKVGVAAALGIYAVGGIAEAIAAWRAPKPPPAPDGPMPPTTAVIVAFLPNEASIILATVEHHLRSGPAGLQVIVAYNTPEPLPVEQALADLAASDPRLRLLKVEHSRSKAENVNAALELVTGEIVAVFDSDHFPELGSYERAWRWLASEADVVQGRCAIRLGAPGSVLPRIVAAEFEQTYTVGHPGRSRLQGFGLFGGSNGYWRVDALRAVKLDPSALTEDIDASVRLLRSGGRIVSDPGIVSVELAPPSIRALCHQRLRWAQGWFQVRRRHLTGLIADRNLAMRQRAGAAWLFGVGPVVSWIGALVLPLSVYGWLDHDAPPTPTVVSFLFAFGTAAYLIQIAVAYRHALPEARRPSIFGAYVIANVFFYAYLRVALVRLSHVHELAGRSVWRVTPRS
jgi:cellulose synthase/poly-beta-1,6-N-acetylglucosamine synthase-like glycosyltransferase